MKRILLLIAMFVLALMVTACGDQNDNDNNASQDDGTTNEDNNQNDTDVDNQDNNDGTDGDTTTKNNDTSGDMNSKMEELDYTDFELEVGYGKNKEYEAEIDLDNGNIKADLEDEINGEDLNGEEAFNKIYPNVEKLTIDQKTAKEDAIKETLKAFNLDDNYVKFNMELTFKDGTKIEFGDKK